MCCITPLHTFDEVQDGCCCPLGLQFCTQMFPPHCHDFGVPIIWAQDAGKDASLIKYVLSCETRESFNYYILLCEFRLDVFGR